ncbi:acetyl/propionyl/methylcrotonyl-CoA carboxylase subunit alpha [Octadecabacter sp. SW4]|uniref:acetyl/propionyl/methylcrotonyl-CoA carboxylase subunit alpha n=1 Tax=Octadecabacter sp. SW4 TaxID=2602067 RepID=UPI0011C1D5D3|nr:acetyl/propionyl/methylcrotonyl-CoA carboxylase subunit alpha [Octadecabacter sp. SW4]QEE36007.1 acetyl/propionyl/methylcrotonyl-CoA carboxylase subunit alpha [Octadecabacter sp. SW4]
MFTRILIANRGEIACRIAQTARAMGVETVAVYSDADAGARHVRMADHAVHIGGAAPADSYLRGDRIIAGALETGAQAIHPGYGFLSENPDFVAAVAKAGLVFIGPSADAIRAMGLKDAAKALMEKAGVPVVPGYHGADQDAAVLARAADDIGYPVMIKAVAGGGGKGMRLVDAAGDFQEALASARAEARTAFGNDAVLIEKYIQHPRHIEVQVFGDGERAVHLFERDCSLQRRHQKVIEEAPAPDMTEAVRAAMGDAAVRAAIAIGYKGAGTVEFIVDGTGGLRADGFWFMEMNTRLQVEHPVTEAITGVDLVAWQVRVAAGQGLPLAQGDLTITGHAFEARLYAEDVAGGFLPATGTLAHLAFPDGVRADSGVETGDEISPFYDPMIAKLVVHGPDRATALADLSRALGDTQVAGTVTNLGFLKALADHAGFRAGQVDTGLIARDLDRLIARQDAPPAVVAQAVLAAAGLPDGSLAGFTLWEPLTRSVDLRLNDQDIAAKLVVQADQATVGWGDHRVSVARDRRGWQVGSRACLRHGDQITVFGAPSYVFTIPDPLARAVDGAAGGDRVAAPMPGLVQAVSVAAGDTVAAGARLCVLEAMKMEYVLRAPRAGVVAALGVKAGDQVAAGVTLVTLEAESEDI